MKILHVNNIAGVPSLLVEGLRRHGIKADVVGRKKHPFGYPHETVIDVPVPVFLFSILKLTRSYDVVHYHGLPYRVFFNIDVFAIKTLKQKLVVHMHGTELRDSHGKISTKVALQISSQIFVSTPDLLRYYPRAVWLPNPIDPNFKPLNNPQRYGKALYFRKWYEPETENLVLRKCDEMGLKLTIPHKPISYNEMPLFLNQFEVFFDRFTIPSLSKTALEALACGCKVMSWRGPITNAEKIIRSHSLSSVTEKLIKIYESILR